MLRQYFVLVYPFGLKSLCCGRSSLLVAMFFMLAGRGPLQAQSDEGSLVLRCDPAMDHLTTKQVYEVLASFDPNARITMHPDQLVLWMGGWVDVHELLSSLNHLGPTRFSVLTPNDPTHRSVEEVTDFPIFHDTGHPLQDSADLDNATQEWLMRHPEFYNRRIPIHGR